VKRHLAFGAGAAAMLMASAAFPCGASFGNNITVDPHQDIIISWKDGVETYVFQPTFCGTATDFGLILPVPAQLSQNPSTSDQRAFASAIALSEPGKRQVVQKAGGCALGGGSAKLTDQADDTPAVVASGRVGFLDWVQLKADSETSFTDWLTSNSYPYSTSAADVFGYYVTKGWYFLAFKISQDAAPAGGTICRALGPVALSFPTATPVVPSRMASAGGLTGSGRMAWRIFGITRGDTQLSFPNVTDQNGGLWYSGTIGAADAPSFAGLADAGDRLTRLVLTFYTTSTLADANLTLASPQDYRGTEDVVVYDDAACSLNPNGRLPQSMLLPFLGLALAGLFCWRRWR
jgi:Uncharacterized protein conserved in bacteria (DUF2330)